MHTLSINKKPVGSVTNRQGRTFRVRLVQPGASYGATGSLTNTHEEPLVEFYDATYAGDDRFTSYGQFVTRYLLGDLDGTRGVAIGTLSGLDLHGGEPLWSLDIEAAAEALAWVQKWRRA